MERTKTPAELEIRLRLTKEQVIYELQVLLVYSKTLTPDQINSVCKILTSLDLDEIAEERAAIGICNNPYCLSPVNIPKVTPTYTLNYKENKVEKFSGKYYCSTYCEDEYKKLHAFLKASVQSHQLVDVKHYYDLCDEYKVVVPRLESLKTQIMDLSEQYQKAIAPDKKAKRKHN